MVSNTFNKQHAKGNPRKLSFDHISYFYSAHLFKHYQSIGLNESFPPIYTFMGFRPILSKLICNFEVLLSTVCVCVHNTTITKRLDESRKNTTTMTTPRNEMIGRVVDIVGIAIGDRGRSCEQHVAYCGVVLAPDVLLCLVKEEIFVGGKV